MSQYSDEILAVRNLSKSFAGIRALSDVSFSLRKGEIHTLMGENGAGKSTFMKILAGLIRADSGEIVLDGQVLDNASPHRRLAQGISMIHQEILMVPALTVAQNIFLGREDEAGGGRLGWISNAQINARAAELLDKVGLNVRPDMPVKALSIAQQQLVEIAKAISHNARVIIMDEPTSALADKEVAVLFDIIRELKRKDVAIIYISHKMEEIFRISDRITILRDGKYIGTVAAEDTCPDDVIRKMVGREVATIFPDGSAKTGPPVLSVKGFSCLGKFSDISFTVHSGEVLGISGLMGAGRTEVARAIFGLDRPDAGTILLSGAFVKIKNPADALAKGIAYVSEDRKALGFLGNMSIADNITLSALSKSRSVFLRNRTEKSAAKKMASSLRIKTASLDSKAQSLSGGNQQKVVIAKALLTDPKVLIIDEPTRGIDVGAKFEIYTLLKDLAAKGLAIVMISSELPEIQGMSDRVIVMSKGRQTAILSKSDLSSETIMKFAVA